MERFDRPRAVVAAVCNSPKSLEGYALETTPFVMGMGKLRPALERLRGSCSIMTTRVAGELPARPGYWRVAIRRHGDPENQQIEASSPEWTEAMEASITAAAQRGWAR